METVKGVCVTVEENSSVVVARWSSG